MVNMWQVLYCVFYIAILVKDNSLCYAKIDLNAVKSSWIPKFSNSLLLFSDEVLAGDKIQRAISDHRTNNEIKILSKDPIQNEVFHKMCENIEQRFTDVKSSVLALKSTAESKTPVKPNGHIQRCCKNRPTTGLHYEGRLRQKVNTNIACIGSRNGSAIPKMDVHKFSDVFKNNYRQYPSVLWQYYASIHGDFIEYPDSNNHQCDKNGNTISPLTEDWFAVKMTKAEKNLVIVFDIGHNTGKTVPGSGETYNELIVQSVKETLQTLTPHDKINVVAFNSNAYTPMQCADGLFIANQRNKDIITDFLKTTNNPSGISDYSAGLEAAYKLIKAEKSITTTNTLDIVMFITDGQLPTVNTTNLFEMIDQNQEKLGHTILHLVYSPATSNNRTKQILTNIAKQHVPNWPVGFNISSIKPNGRHVNEGFVYFDSDLSHFPFDVATRFTSVIPETANTDKTYAVIAPVIEDNIGLKMTISMPVVDKFTNNSLIGTAAVDVSMATMFTEIEDFILGVHSYAFLIEKRHGHVLLHPKLKDPANTTPDQTGETIFPAINTLEPNLSKDQIHKLMNDIDEFGSFTTKMIPGRSTFMTNVNVPLKDATIFYKTLTGTWFVMVMVMFHTDGSFLALHSIPKNFRIPHSPYHRIDINHKFPVCSIDGHVVAPAITTVKLSPFVFVNSEVYKFTEETTPRVGLISYFLTGRNNRDFIKTDLRAEIWHSLIETQDLTDYWRGSKHQVIERFFGAPNGVFRMYPGVALSNTFDHVQYQWYKKSVARYKDLIFTSEKISEFTPKDVVIFTRAIAIEDKSKPGSDRANLRGVVGATMTHSQLTATMINNLADCSDKGLECHLLDDQGFLLTHGTADVNGKHTIHLTRKFPWLATQLIQKKLFQPVWCTSMSEGIHQLSYSIQVPPEGEIDNNTDDCRMFVIGAVTGTNLFLLVVNDRKSHSCTDTEVCESCGPTYSKCNQCIGGTKPICQCPCYCDVDFDQCSSQFNDSSSTYFPHQACYYKPLHLKFTEIKAGPVKLCEKPCQAIEEEDKCNLASNCIWNTTEVFPLCVYKIITTTTARIPPKKPTKPFKTPPPHLTVTKMVPMPTKLQTSTNKIPMVSTNKHPVTHKIPPRPTKKQQTQKIPDLPTTIEITSKSSETSSVSSKDTSKSGLTTSPITHTYRSNKQSGENNIGLIVGLVLAGLIVIVLALFIVLRIFGKPIQNALGNTTAGKYVRRNSVVDRMMFSKVNDEVVMSKAPYNTAVPYGQMT